MPRRAQRLAWRPPPGSVRGAAEEPFGGRARLGGMASAFHLISLPVGSEEMTLQAALDTLADVEPGESVFFSEAVAWTAAGSGVAFARLVKAARQRNVNLLA